MAPLFIRYKNNMNENNPLPSHLGGHFNETHLDNGVLDYMIEKYKVESFLDVGCGPGGMVELALSKGLKAFGIDGDYTVERNTPVLIHDYTLGPANIEDNFDMCWSCEFLEHVDEKYIPNFMNSFQKCKYVIATHADPGQWGHHHVNCQPYSYWKDVFAQYGFKCSAMESLKIREISTMPANHLKRSGLFFINKNM
jgi:SAM-dependent methyltransferase